ncbi:MAG: hypothetical protein V3V20_09065 [Algisphaera sp.]
MEPDAVLLARITIDPAMRSGKPCIRACFVFAAMRERRIASRSLIC